MTAAQQADRVASRGSPAWTQAFLKALETVKVIFEYDEQAAKWMVLVTGASDETEARQAFAAVVITCGETNGHCISTQTPEGVAITPAV